MRIQNAKFEVVTAVVVKVQIFWDVTLCQLVNSYNHMAMVTGCWSTLCNIL
jgi:hypothetical protein